MSNHKKRLVIRAFPLSQNRVIMGTFFWLDYIKNNTNILYRYNDIILGNEEQHIEMMTYINRIKAFIIKHGGFTSHIAIVCRELDIPIYKYEKIDKLKNYDKVLIIPSINFIKVDDKYIFKIIIKNINEKTISYHQIYELVKGISNFLTIEKIEIKNNIIFIYTKGIKKLINEAINNPSKIIEEIENNRIFIGTSFVSMILAELLIPYLIESIGFDNAMKAISQHTPYWFIADKDYLKVRFNINYNPLSLNNVIKKNELKEVNSKQNNNQLAELITLAIKVYESKNLR